MSYRIEAQCEDNHSWSVLSDNDELDPGVCGKCGRSPVLVVARELPDRLLISLEPAMFIDEFSEKLMREKLYFVSLYRDGNEFLVRTPNPLSWNDCIKLIDSLRDHTVERALKIWNSQYKS